MRKLRFKCRVEGQIKNHSVLDKEIPLGDDVVFVQCLSCGVMGIEQLANVKESKNAEI